MSVNRKKVGLYGFLLAAAGIGLLIDHTSGWGGTKTAAAADEPVGWVDPTDGEDLGVAAPPIATIFDANRLGSGPSRSAGLIGSLIRPRDPFGLSPQMRKHYRSESERVQQARAIVEKKKKGEAKQSMETFRRGHSLGGTFIHGADKWALVDGRILRIGDRLDGYQLRAVERYRAVFAQGTKTVKLKLPTAGETKVGPAKPR